MRVPLTYFNICLSLAGNRRTRGVPGVRGNPGHFSVRFYPLRDPRRSVYQVDRLPTRSDDFHFQLQDMRVDLRTGGVEIGGKSATTAADVAAKCCLAVSVATLFVLCQPRPPGPPRAQKTVDANGRRVRQINSESLTMVVAAGFLVDTPSNCYFTTTVYGGTCGGCGGTWGGGGGGGDGGDGGDGGGACGGCGGCGGGGGGGGGGGCGGDGGGCGGGGCGGGGCGGGGCGGGCGG